MWLNLEKKKIFKRILSFLIAASLVNVPVYANNLLEKNDAKNILFEL
jgi:hypothetical protein